MEQPTPYNDTFVYAMQQFEEMVYSLGGFRPAESEVVAEIPDSELVRAFLKARPELAIWELTRGEMRRVVVEKWEAYQGVKPVKPRPARRRR